MTEEHAALLPLSTILLLDADEGDPALGFLEETQVHLLKGGTLTPAQVARLLELYRLHEEGLKDEEPF